MKKIPFFQRIIEKKWFFPFITLLSVITVFVTFISMEIVLIVTTLIKPKYWLKTAFLLSMGSAVGAFAFSELLESFASPYIQKFYETGQHPQWWQSVYLWVTDHGLFALVPLVISPLPLTPLIVLFSALKIMPTSVFVSVWMGRMIKYSVMGQIVVHFPKIFRKKLE